MRSITLLPLTSALLLLLVVGSPLCSGAFTTTITTTKRLALPSLHQHHNHQPLLLLLSFNKRQRATTTTTSRLLTPSLLFATIPQKDEVPPFVEFTTFEVPIKIRLGKAIPYEELTIGVMKETYPGENRVSQSPDSVAGLVKAGFRVMVQAGGT